MPVPSGLASRVPRVQRCRVTPDQFLARCPALWHVAPAGAWDTIRETGLRTAAQLIDGSDLDETARTALHGTPRAEPVRLSVDGADVVLRAQVPLVKADLTKALEPGLAVEDWVRELNRRVYLFADRAAMQKAVEKYVEADGAQDVIIFSPLRLFEQEQASIELSAQSTAAVGRKSDPAKGRDTFLSITRFPNRKPSEITLVDGLADLAPVVRAERHHADGSRVALPR